MTREEQARHKLELTRIFSPSTPISSFDLFAGRSEQLLRIGRAVNTPGQHAAVFGERGVGKTSLVTILRDLLPQQGAYVVKVNCVEQDSFASVWRRALSEIVIDDARAAIGYKPQVLSEYRTLAEYAPENINPADIRRIIRGVAESSPLTIIFDEFDRMSKNSGRAPFADTIKDLADNGVSATLVLVGVGKDVEDLVAEHNSIARSLVEVEMQRMNRDELQEIIDKALPITHMTMEPQARDLIVFLSKGLPHYTHLLGQESAIAAIESDSLHIAMAHFERGIKRAIQNSQQSVTRAYQQAITSQRKDNLFGQVLLACALTRTDEFGFFISADVRDSLNAITGEDYDIPNFSQHLDKFSGDETRGLVLEKSGTSRRFRFKFRNPLLQPYVLMKGVQDEMVTGTLLKSLSETVPSPHRRT